MHLIGYSHIGLWLDFEAGGNDKGTVHLEWIVVIHWGGRLKKSLPFSSAI